MIGDKRSDEEEEEVQSDEVSERMAEVIEKVESVHTETVTPHWETVENDDGEPTIYHLHDDRKVPATVISPSPDSRAAKCSECDAELELGATPASARR
jgi:hypothetical protein